MAVHKLTFNIFNLILSFINIFFHSLGISLLVKLYKKTVKPTQHLLITHLSVAELVTSLFRAASVIIQLLPEKYMPIFRPPTGPRPPGPPRPPPQRTDAQLTADYLNIFCMTGCTFVVFLIMLAITLDRLLVVVLRSSYDRFCSVFNTKILLLLIWVLGGIAPLIGFSVAYKVDNYRHHYHTEYYIYLVLDVVFMVAAIASFVVVLLKYRGYEMHEENTGEADGEPNQVDTSTPDENKGRTPGSRSQWTIVRTLSDPYFHIPLLIIFTYFVFVVLPHWIYIGKKYEEGIRNPGSDPWAAMLILLQIAYWSDAIVYIFIQAPVRNLLWKWLGCKKGASNGTPARSHENGAANTKV